MTNTAVPVAVPEPERSTDAALRFLYLSEPDMIEAGVTDMAACVDTMERMFAIIASGDYRMGGADNNSHGMLLSFPSESPFPGMPLDAPDRRFIAMPGYLGGEFGTVGMKWYGSNVENRQQSLPRSIHLFVLNDRDTGAPLAVMSGNLLSAYRTGAIPGVGARHLAKQDSRVVGMVGPGVMNRTALASLLVARPGIERLQIAGRSATSTNAFVEYVERQYPGLQVVVADGIEAAVRDADIVSVATSGSVGSANYPFIDEAWLKPGAFVSLPANSRFDDDFVLNRARVVLDFLPLYEAWKEELPSPTWEAVGLLGMRCMDLISEGRLAPERLDDLSQHIAGTEPITKNEDEIVLLSVGGMPVEDIAWATTIYRTAAERGVGTELPLWDRPVLA